MIDNGTELTLYLQHSHLFYLPSLKLARTTPSVDSDPFSKQISKEVKPSEINTDVQGITMYRFESMGQGVYTLIIS